METFRDTHFSVIHDSQNIFRVILDSVARPGKLNQFPQVNLTAPSGSNPYIIAALRTLLDQQVSFSILADNEELSQAIEQYLLRNTGSYVSVLSEADFVYSLNGDTRGHVLSLKRGRAEFPEEGATIIYGVESILSGRSTAKQCGQSSSTTSLHLSGPGIPGESEVSVVGIMSEEIAHLTTARALFPLGVDAILVDEAGGIIGLPRTTKIRIR